MILDWEGEEWSEALGTSAPGVLDGRAVAAQVRKRVRLGVEAVKKRGVKPRLVVVQVGEDEASTIYIQYKQRACREVGIAGEHLHLPGTIEHEELCRRLAKLNEDESIHGILLQLPLPEHLDSAEVMAYIDPTKDVDGFHPTNLGALMTRKGLLEPCTPRGILRLLMAAGVHPRGKQAAVIGRSVIVGRPMALMLTRADATVTLCHRHTENLEEVVRRSELLVVATGVPRLVRGDWIREGATVIDVGITRLEEGLVGDVEYEGARKRTRWITPVPGGVGPMTVAMLMENTLKAACISREWVIRDGEARDAQQAGLHYGHSRRGELTWLSSN